MCAACDGSLPLTLTPRDEPVEELKLDPKASKQDVAKAMREIGRTSVVKFVPERRAAGDPDVTFAAHFEITSGALMYSCCEWPVVGTSVTNGSLRHPADG